MRLSTTTPANREKLDQIHAALTELLASVLKRGFHGTAALEMTVQDGTIQNFRRKVEQLQR